MTFPPMYDEFAKAAHGREERKTFEQLMQALSVGVGNLDESQVSGNVARGLAASKTSSSDKDRKRKQEAGDIAFVRLLDDIRQRLEELETRMAQRLDLLKAKYGEDVADAMADTFLADAEKTGLDSDKDKLEALARKFLTPEGTIRDEYVHLEEAQYIRDWSEAQMLRPVIAKFSGLDTLEAEGLAEVYGVAQSVGLAGQDNALLRAENQSIKGAVEDVLEEHRINQELIKIDSSLNFK